ncbi:hypothetical protein QA612_08515 [Evansella sp. AB-P1]|uniref:hypothetical protein n=1 Tax=Evansella sp. AB-P1 TaxID=3037653 RepID=UPI00241E4409|nr:hypothetical protein [Evansella sp. AB-P1]MDG5787536.1 hypothetical protein [Evansella sp. AB-P1]
MSWRERAWEQKWIEPFLPNYLKPLKDDRVESEHTKELIQEAEEFLTDLASLSELPRLNKTFKRTIKGFMFKVKIKQKKIFLELIDTKKSPTDIRKRIYITIYRKEYKAEKGMGKCVDSTIYYQLKNRTIVRNIRKHPLFQSLFIRLNQLDHSLSNKNGEILPEIVEATENNNMLSNETIEDKEYILTTLNNTFKQYNTLDPLIKEKLKELKQSVKECMSQFDLLDIEEKHHLKRLVNNDLPSLLETYHSLSIDQKAKSYDDVVESIQSMCKYINNQSKHLSNTRMDRMDQLLQLNKLRYETTTVDTKKKDDY